MEQVCPKEVIPVKTGKSKHHYWIFCIQISLGTNFQLKLVILIFLTKFAQKRCYRSKTKKSTSPLNSAYSNFSTTFEMFFCTTFQLKPTILIIFVQICLKTKFLVGNWKIAVVRACMVVTYYIKAFRRGADRHNGILMSLLLLVAETIITLNVLM